MFTFHLVVLFFYFSFSFFFYWRGLFGSVYIDFINYLFTTFFFSVLCFTLFCFVCMYFYWHAQEYLVCENPLTTRVEKINFSTQYTDQAPPYIVIRGSKKNWAAILQILGIEAYSKVQEELEPVLAESKPDPKRI